MEGKWLENGMLMANGLKMVWRAKGLKMVWKAKGLKMVWKAKGTLNGLDG